MKYKIGTKVRILDTDELHSWSSQNKCVNKIGTITGIGLRQDIYLIDHNEDIYLIDHNEYGINFKHHMLAPVSGKVNNLILEQ